MPKHTKQELVLLVLFISKFYSKNEFVFAFLLSGCKGRTFKVNLQMFSELFFLKTFSGLVGKASSFQYVSLNTPCFSFKASAKVVGLTMQTKYRCTFLLNKMK